MVRSIDGGQVSAFSLFDLSSAFDTVDRDNLLSILYKLYNRFSIDHAALNWFHSYLSNRSISVFYLYGGNQTIPLTQLHAASLKVQSLDLLNLSATQKI
jgi:hypothetical protein